MTGAAYFLGQTGLLTFGDDKQAWGGLFNPSDSGVRFVCDQFTVTNYAPEPFILECWLNNRTLGQGSVSRHVASVNQKLSPPPIPKVELRDADRLRELPKDGLFSFVQLAEAKATTAVDIQTMIIVPPGCSMIAFLRSLEPGTLRARIAFGWREEARLTVHTGRGVKNTP
ncbi:DUF6143 family protein [Paenibacillus silvisoli]|uniref:DUF6143 family protein n=1 Tax=Paenibacillus silvisoli TaxID=3110539 RepID=UPI0028040CCF|nr:DUF6143 family protein [Paenibacillus silvisoli]